MKMNITPEYAKVILANNNNNRIPSERHIEFLSRQMLEGTWIYNGQTIVVDSSFNLIDGQHRLMACVKAGRSFETEMITGVDSDKAFATIDTGKVRSANDLLGITGCKNRHRVASVTRQILEMERFSGKDFDFKFTGIKFTNAEIIGRISEDDDIENFASLCGRIKTPMIAGLYLLSKKDLGGVTEFIEKVKAGLFSSSDCPAKHLSSWESNKKLSNNGLRTIAAAVAIKAFDAYKANIGVKRLGFNTETGRFPKYR